MFLKHYDKDRQKNCPKKAVGGQKKRFRAEIRESRLLKMKFLVLQPQAVDLAHIAGGHE